MTRSIIVIAVVGIAAALICLPLAAMLYRHGNHLESWDWSGYQGWFGEDDDDDSGDRDRGGERGRIESRDFAWGAADRLELDVPANLHFQPAAAMAPVDPRTAASAGPHARRWRPRGDSAGHTTTIPRRSRSSCQVRRCVTSPSTARASWYWMICSRMH
jgi:hypothetical protein